MIRMALFLSYQLHLQIPFDLTGMNVQLIVRLVRFFFHFVNIVKCIFYHIICQ